MTNHSSAPGQNQSIRDLLPKQILALDGLRGLAILGVVLFHAAVDYSPRTQVGSIFSLLLNVGWAGVDLFFVLSGFLITGILLESRGAEGFFRKFYARRTLRIFPLYYGVLFFIFVILPHFKPFDTVGLQTIARNQGWFWTYLTNLGFVVHGSVFGNSDWLLLNHFWSLAVEEQFYLAWPLLVWWLPTRFLKGVCLILFVESLLLRSALAALHQRSGALFFPTPCRLDALALGAWLAMLVRDPTIAPARLFDRARVVAVAGAVALAGLFVWTSPGLKTVGLRFNERPQLTVGISLFALLSAALLLLALDPAPGNWLRRALECRPLRVLGKFSYAMYVFHQLLIPVFERWVPIEELYRVTHSELLAQGLHAAAMVLGSLAIAVLSWHLYEKHFLRLKRFFEYPRNQEWIGQTSANPSNESGSK